MKPSVERDHLFPRLALACPCCWLGSLGDSSGVPQAPFQLLKSHTLHIPVCPLGKVSWLRVPFYSSNVTLRVLPPSLVAAGEGGCGVTVQPVSPSCWGHCPASVTVQPVSLSFWCHCPAGVTIHPGPCGDSQPRGGDGSGGPGRHSREVGDSDHSE